MDGRRLLERVQDILGKAEPSGSLAEDAYSREANIAMAALFHFGQGRRGDALLAFGAILDVARPTRRRQWVDLVRELAAPVAQRAGRRRQDETRMRENEAPSVVEGARGS